MQLTIEELDIIKKQKGATLWAYKQGGTVVNFQGNEWLVATEGGIILENASLKDINQALKVISREARLDFSLIGFWFEGDKVYIDIVKGYEDTAKAITEGLKNKQLAIYHNGTKETLYLEDIIKAVKG
jgi:hypothetical protein